MVIARMPEDQSKTFKNLQITTSKTFNAMYTCITCTPVGPTDYNILYPSGRANRSYARPQARRPPSSAWPGRRRPVGTFFEQLRLSSC
eukprot:2004439-Heterocapsa_arctica.AAC.1